MLGRIMERGGFQVTFNTTETCNLRCKYCYEINKRNKHLKLDDAKKFIDLLIETEDPCLLDDDPMYNNMTLDHGITLDFIGGDSLMNVELLDQILHYWVYKVNTVDNERTRRWKFDYRVSITTNGTLFTKPEVQKFIEKWLNVLSINVSIDGCPEIHDMYRVFPDGRGSMSEILKGWDWYKAHFPYESVGTKSTCSKASIPYLYDSLVFMHEKLGLTQINQNFIMEDTGCTEEDYKLLDEQLHKCADYCLEHLDEFYWGILSDSFASAHRSEGDEWVSKGHCGSGAMPALSVNGKIYPCFRWLPHTQYKDNVMCVGDVNNGGFTNKENFLAVRHGCVRCKCTTEEKCRNCEYESACAYCIAGDYAEHDDFIRSTYICEITKLQVKWARYYWSKYLEKKGLPAVTDWSSFRSPSVIKE